MAKKWIAWAFRIHTEHRALRAVKTLISIMSGLIVPAPRPDKLPDVKKRATPRIRVLKRPVTPRMHGRVDKLARVARVQSRSKSVTKDSWIRANGWRAPSCNLRAHTASPFVQSVGGTGETLEFASALIYAPKHVYSIFPVGCSAVPGEAARTQIRKVMYKTRVKKKKKSF